MTRTIARSDAGRVRDGNEDRYVVREDHGVVLMAVADGVGGEEGGEIAAGAAVAELALRFFAAPRDRALEDRLADAIRDANTAVLRAAESSGNRHAAATLVAAVLRRDHLVIANLGDSRAYLVRDGAPRQLTEDHRGATRHAITRFVGDPRGVQPDVFVEDLRPADRLVLCSDGLTRHVSPEEIAAAVAHAPIDDAANALVALANARGGEDNVTVVLHDARGARGSRPSRRAIGIALAVVVLAVVGAFAALLSLAPSPR
ncbi:MAG TPA: protein phosphatase 2C domain-containing protein [Candidatus Limnocylindria bacterium]|nr:protein phosphatase 2C domain-containing protein [Candidatus Limnocylindria bacterium]